MEYPDFIVPLLITIVKNSHRMEYAASAVLLRIFYLY